MIKSMNRLNTVGPVKVGSLKSQLHLRPSYDELFKETLVGDENRPSIENVRQKSDKIQIKAIR